MQIDDTASSVSVGLRVQPDRFAVVGQGLVELEVPSVFPGPAEQGAGEFRVQFLRLLDVCRAKTILLCSRRAVARCTYAITVCGFMAMAPVSMASADSYFLQFAQRHARGQEGEVMIGLLRQGLPVAGQGLVLLAVLRVVLTEQVMVRRGRGLQ